MIIFHLKYVKHFHMFDATRGKFYFYSAIRINYIPRTVIRKSYLCTLYRCNLVPNRLVLRYIVNLWHRKNRKLATRLKS